MNHLVLTVFLYPIVEEFKKLWIGERFNTAKSTQYKVTYRAMLLCAACDIPAGRKLCGFKGCNEEFKKLWIWAKSMFKML